jgi:hypothetical protein
VALWLLTWQVNKDELKRNEFIFIITCAILKSGQILQQLRIK